jgi:hypothetical protein
MNRMRTVRARTVRGARSLVVESLRVDLRGSIEGIATLVACRIARAGRIGWHSPLRSAALRFFDAFRTMWAEPLLAIMQPSSATLLRAGAFHIDGGL